MPRSIFVVSMSLFFHFQPYFQGTLMQMCKSVNIFVFILQYGDDFTLKHLSLFEICSREIPEKFVYDHSETIEYVKN